MVISNLESRTYLVQWRFSLANMEASIYKSLLDDSTPQVCDANQDYDLSAIPNIDSLLADGAYSLCI